MPNDNYANEPNQSRSEDIIQSILDNTEYDEEARSRIEYLLIELKNAIEGGGGGGGVTSYAPLTEKPKIDNYTLQAGNNTSSDLGLQTKLTFDSTPTENSTNPVTSGGVYTALDSKANSSDVYNKSAVDTALMDKADKSTTYTKTEVDAALNSKQNTISDLSTIRSGAALGATAIQPVSGKGLSTNDYTTAEKTKLAGIAEGAEVNVQSNWTQTTTTADDYIKNKPTLGTAAAKNATDTYNATGTDVTTGRAVAAALATLPEPMVFKGSLGTGGTITTLPAASSSNKGYTYKVITAGTYASQSAKVGDTFISDGSAWVLIPSGDEPSGTVTNVAVANGGGLTVSGSPITSSGTITVGHSNSVTAKTSSSVKKFTYDEHGHVTGSSELSTAESNALASGIDSEKVAQISTNKNNISYIENTGKKNWLKPDTISGVPTGLTIQYEPDDSITINGTYSGSDYAYVFLYAFSHEAMQYTMSCNVSTTSNTYYFYTKDNKMSSNFTPTYTYAENDTTKIVMRIAPNTPFSNVNVKLMIRPSIITDPTYQPYAMSNAELTAAEKQNKNNISKDEAALVELVDSGAKNLSDWDGGAAATDSSFVVQNEPITLKKATYAISFDTTANSGRCEIVFRDSNGIVGSYTFNNTSSSTLSAEITLTADAVKFNIFTTKAATITNFMICTKAAWDISNAYQPYALSNAELTSENETNKNNISKDEAALVELVDGGAKNIVQIGTAVTVTKNGVTAVSNTDGSVTISGVSTSGSQFLIINDLYSGSTTSTYGSQIPIKAGNYVVKATGTRDVLIQAINYNSSDDITVIDSSNDDVEFTVTKSYIVFRLVIRGNTDFTTPVTIYPMCCDSALYAISPEFVPYRPSYQELYERVVALEQANQ